MSNMFCVNMSGKKVPVYADTEKKKQIGIIYPREAFGYNRNWGGDDYFCNIVFRNSSGKLSGGFINDPPNNSIRDCADYPYGSVSIGGIKYKTFLMRKSRTVYTASGRKWGAVAANCKVACLTGLAGDSDVSLKGINYVQSSKGNWVRVAGDGDDYGFVDTGLSVGSSYNNIPFYGAW
ncbi:hypothetical protein SAMN04487831_106141 [Pseudobutyrivibrio sp. UC1225]|uniref:hypothetical protein n=1 Tax=Pseudobutyrivibrio sp. UC1225 TaxID=1798185 RepID=UPI0008ECD37C|nr:hypothetical protein [Pseudobutyrivibrio sp. UC1225]SFO03835.1 hypothetical protein SAMN04487831_106141 [Pseudobutyrivibrio sp. UC1225]